MLKRSVVCPMPRSLVKPEEVLTSAEVRQLMQAFTRGKTEVVEDDCITLLGWAQEQRLRGLLLEWVLEGSIQPHVVKGEVRLSLPPQASAC